MKCLCAYYRFSICILLYTSLLTLDFKASLILLQTEKQLLFLHFEKGGKINVFAAFSFPTYIVQTFP
jgi:hypothetical protein